MPASHPILSLDEARRLEEGLFQGDEAREWQAMSQAGAGIAGSILADFKELGDFPSHARLLVLAGKGHNGGDALLATRTILGSHPAAVADVWFLFGEKSLRPLAAKAWRELFHAFPARIRTVCCQDQLAAAYDLMIDGVVGFQYRPPLDTMTRGIFADVNRHPVRMRAAVDLPSGLGDKDGLWADFTYATGCVKQPVVEEAALDRVGRLRCIDLGFFAANADSGTGRKEADPQTGGPACERILVRETLDPLRRLRPVQSDKRSQGHVYVLGGSRNYPGAALMSVLAAVRSGAGLVTAFVPESLVSSMVVRVPEAIWVGWPETPQGGLALEGMHLLRERLGKATSLVLGPGMGCEPETLVMAGEAVKISTVPLVIDADALRAEIVSAGQAPRILTPHAGEYARIAPAIPAVPSAVLVRKGPVTRICSQDTTYLGCAGGPVLARGGSGDILAGLIGGLLAQRPDKPLEAACLGVAWQGRAADLLARVHGQVAVATTQIIDFLADALRNEGP